MPQFECPACHATGEAPSQVGAFACPRCGHTVSLAATGVTTPEIAEAQQARKRAKARLPVSPRPAEPESSSSGSWVFIIGLLCGAALLIFMAWDGFKSPEAKRDAHSDHIVVATDENWQKEVIDSDVPVLVDFYADWCGPCKALAPTIDRLADRFHGKVKVVKLNVDHAEKTSARYQVNSIPRLMLFKNGKSQTLEMRSEAELATVLDHVSQ